MHHRRDDQQRQKRYREYCDIRQLGELSEKGRHDQKANVGKRHLYTYHRLRFVLTEDRRRHMYDAGVYRRATQTYNGKADQRKDRRTRHEQKYYSHGGNAKTRPYQETVAESHGEKAVRKSSDRHTDVKKTCKARRRLGSKIPTVDQIAARPERAGYLERAIGKEGYEAGNSALGRKYLLKGERS